MTTEKQLEELREYYGSVVYGERVHGTDITRLLDLILSLHKRVEALEKRKDWLPCQNCYPRSTECSFCNNTGVIINEPR